MMKTKTCKGINKAKGVKGCGKESLNRKFGLCPSCLYEWATTNDPVIKSDRETQERALLYVSATRAKREVVVSCFGKPSRFIG